MSEIDIPDDGEVLAALRAALTKLLTPDDLHQIDLTDIGPRTPMLSLPVDSVVLMALMTELEDTFAVYIDEESAFSFTAVGDIADHIRQRLAAKALRRERS